MYAPAYFEMSDDISLVSTAASSPSRRSGYSSEKVEKLLNKYKKIREERKSPLVVINQKAQECKRELENTWNEMNKRLIDNGYTSISIDTVGLNDNSGDCISLNQYGVTQLSHTLLTLLNDLQRKDAIISKLTAQRSTPPPPVSDGSTLDQQLKELKYANAKLRVDLLNRPHAAELRACQNRVKELEVELNKHKSQTSHHQYNNTIHQIQNIKSLLCVEKYDDIMSAISSLKHQSKQIKDIQPHLVTVSGLFNNNVAHTNVLCPDLWEGIGRTLVDWKARHDGITDLKATFGELYERIERKKIQRDEITFNQMSSILHHWLDNDQHKKMAEVSAITAAIDYFKYMFNISTLQGVYPAISVVHRQLNESRTAHRLLTEMFGLSSSSSWNSIVECCGGLAGGDLKRMEVELMKRFGKVTIDEIIRSLSLSRYFFPSFRAFILQLQNILGVESLSAVIPAVKQLTIKK